MKAVTSSENLWLMKKCRKGYDEVVGDSRVSNYYDEKKISREAGERSIKRVGKLVPTRGDRRGTAIMQPGLTATKVVDPDVQKVLRKHGSDDVINEEHKPRKVFWSRHFVHHLY